MALNHFNVSYDNFQLDDIIHPDEFNINFEDIMIRFNQIIDVLNQITDGIGGNGADIVHIGEVLPFTSDRLQSFLQELVDQLRSSDGDSGAQFIGSSRIPGVDGNTVQEQLLSFKGIIDEFKSVFESEITRVDHELLVVNDRVDDVIGDLSSLTVEVDTNKQSIDDLEELKANKSDVYTKGETDNLVIGIGGSYYSKSETDSMLDDKTDKIGNHAGTWQGIDVSDITGIVGANGVYISNTRPSNPVERGVWYNPSLNEYQIYISGEWRIQSKPTQIKKVHNRVVLNSSASSVDIGIDGFNPELDAFIVAQNSVFVAEGYEYNVSSDGLKIVHPNGSWASGTVFDFTAFISVPVRE